MWRAPIFATCTPCARSCIGSGSGRRPTVHPSDGMKLVRIRWKEAAALLLIGLWWGIPALLVWKADRLVDDLCAANGGFNVYEPVLLSGNDPDPLKASAASDEGGEPITATY